MYINIFAEIYIYKNLQQNYLSRLRTVINYLNIDNTKKLIDIWGSRYKGEKILFYYILSRPTSRTIKKINDHSKELNIEINKRNK